MTVLACFTDSEEGRLAVQRGIAEAVHRGLSLAIINIDPDRNPSSLREMGISDAAAHIPDLQISMVPPSAAVHDPADHVLVAEQSLGAELIVLGLRRRSRVGKLIMGSHAQRILLDADCPVLTVKANQ